MQENTRLCMDNIPPSEDFDLGIDLCLQTLEETMTGSTVVSSQESA